MSSYSEEIIVRARRSTPLRPRRLTIPDFSALFTTYCVSLPLRASSPFDDSSIPHRNGHNGDDYSPATSSQSSTRPAGERASSLAPTSTMRYVSPSFHSYPRLRPSREVPRSCASLPPYAPLTYTRLPFSRAAKSSRSSSTPERSTTHGEPALPLPPCGRSLIASCPPSMHPGTPP